MTVRTSTSLLFAVLLTLTNGFLDAHTYMARGGVFANVQTGNVIFFAIDLAGHHPWQALSHLWPIPAFLVGVLVAAHVKSGRVERLVPHPLAFTMGIQVVLLTVVGFVPATAPHEAVTIPISFLAGIQIGLFRSIHELVYLPVATTGNLMRVMEAGYARVVDKNPDAAGPLKTYATLTTAFASGALFGAFSTKLMGIHAIWLSAAILAATLILFVVDQRRGIAP